MADIERNRKKSSAYNARGWNEKYNVKDPLKDSSRERMVPKERIERYNVYMVGRTPTVVTRR